jgi:RNA polymerase sigma factor (sigma-70 family)
MLMSGDGAGSVTRWIGDLVASGDDVALEKLWSRYFEQLVRIARSRLQRMGRPAVDAEDAALSALHNFHRAATQGGTLALHDRDDLWRLLVTITARKAHDLAEREARQKRGGGRRGESPDVLEGMLGPEPTPEFLTMMAEQHDRMMDALADDSLRQVARMRLEGHTNDEIAAQLGCARRTVANKLELIRKRWTRDDPS